MSNLSYTQPAKQIPMSRPSLRATEPFRAVAREFLLHNASPEDIKLEWHGETRVIPAIDRVARKHPRLQAGDMRYSDVPHSMLDERGEYIPGTLILRDLIGPSGAVTWSAEEAIRNKLGINPESGAYEGAYALRGLSILPADCTPQEITEIVADGRARYMTWVERNDRVTILEWEAAIAAHKAKKLPAPAPPEYVEQAAARLRERAQERNMALADLMSEGRNDRATREVVGAAIEASSPTPAAQILAEENAALKQQLADLAETVRNLVVKDQDREQRLEEARRKKAATQTTQG